MKEKFLEAIHQKKLVRIKLNSHEKGVICRKCAPFDYGVSRRYKDGRERYHFYDLECPDGENHNLSPLPEQLLEIEILEESFDPGTYVDWTPNWIVARDWGQYS